MKLFAVVLLVFLAVSCSASVLRIYGGDDVTEKNKYPYQVSVQVYGRHNCGGSIISDQWILTAAHCVKGYSTDSFSVVVGIIKLDDEERTKYKVDYKTHHELFDYNNLSNDIGLIHVKKPIALNKYVQSVPLQYYKFNEKNATVTLTGWGRMENGFSPNTLQEVNLTLYDQDLCKKDWANYNLMILPGHICTYTRIGQGACNGDSGGPLVYKGNQVGIVSFGKPCALGYPDVFTRVSKYVHWIKNKQASYEKLHKKSS